MWIHTGSSPGSAATRTFLLHIPLAAHAPRGTLACLTHYTRACTAFSPLPLLYTLPVPIYCCEYTVLHMPSYYLYLSLYIPTLFAPFHTHGGTCHSMAASIWITPSILPYTVNTALLHTPAHCLYTCLPLFVHTAPGITSTHIT